MALPLLGFHLRWGDEATGQGLLALAELGLSLLTGEKSCKARWVRREEGPPGGVAPSLPSNICTGDIWDYIHHLHLGYIGME